MEKKGISIIIFLFCFLVFSCKKDENKITVIQDYEKEEQRTLEMMELEQSIYILNVYPNPINFMEYVLFKNIRTEYSSKTIEEEYFNTYSNTKKIYLYWVLCERDWDNVSPIIVEDLLMRGSEEIKYLSGCILYSMPLREMIVRDLRFNKPFNKPEVEFYERIIKERELEFFEEEFDTNLSNINFNN